VCGSVPHGSTKACIVSTAARDTSSTITPSEFDVAESTEAAVSVQAREGGNLGSTAGPLASQPGPILEAPVARLPWQIRITMAEGFFVTSSAATRRMNSSLLSFCSPTMIPFIS
jgi:hypothetical protein